MAGNALKSGDGPDVMGPLPRLTDGKGPKNRSSSIAPCFAFGVSSARKLTTRGSLSLGRTTLGMLVGMLVTPAFFKMDNARSLNPVLGADVDGWAGAGCCLGC